MVDLVTRTEPVIVDGRQSLLNGGVEIGEIRLPVLAIGGPHAVVHIVAVRHGGLPVRSGDEVFPQVAGKGLVQPGLQEGQLPGADGVQPGLVCLNAVDLVAVLREAQGRGQPHKAQSNDGYHMSSSSLLSFTYSRKYRTPCSTGT